MSIQLRQENPVTYPAIESLLKEAFKDLPVSDNTEYLLVARLRETDSYIPELAIVAALNGKIVGYILFTRLKIRNEHESFDTLSLAPVAVLPDYQKQGIGSKLIREGHKIARELGFCSVILVGHEDYYPKFGYKKASSYGIKLPFEAPDENCMALELVDGGLEKVNGMVEYPKAFFEK